MRRHFWLGQKVLGYSWNATAVEVGKGCFPRKIPPTWHRLLEWPFNKDLLLKRGTMRARPACFVFVTAQECGISRTNKLWIDNILLCNEPAVWSDKEPALVRFINLGCITSLGLWLNVTLNVFFLANIAELLWLMATICGCGWCRAELDLWYDYWIRQTEINYLASVLWKWFRCSSDVYIDFRFWVFYKVILNFLVSLNNVGQWRQRVDCICIDYLHHAHCNPSTFCVPFWEEACAYLLEWWKTRFLQASGCNSLGAETSPLTGSHGLEWDSFWSSVC